MYGPGSGSRGPFRPRIDFMSASLLLLGLGSFSFHASLRQYFQFADELSMLGLAWATLQGALFSPHQTPLRNTTSTAVLAIGIPLFGVFYVWSGEILYHVAVFGVLISLIVLRGYYAFYWCIPGLPNDKRLAWGRRGKKTVALLVAAFVLWNIDLEFCAPLRRLRTSLGLPWAWLLELHGWWHILTAVCADRTMQLVREVHAQVEAMMEVGKDKESSSTPQSKPHSILPSSSPPMS